MQLRWFTLAMALALPQTWVLPCDAKAPAPRCPASDPERDTLSTSDAINDAAREVWSIEDESVNARRLVNPVLGVTAAYGGWFRSNGDWAGRFFVAPTAALRIGKRQLSQDYVIERNRARLERLQRIVLPTIVQQLGSELEKAQEEKTRVQESLAKLSKAPAPAAQEAIDQSAASTATQDTSAPDDYRAALEKNLRRQLEGIEKRTNQLNAELAAANAWRARACNLELALQAKPIAIVGGELMMGYAFDVLTNPDKSPKSAVIGGIGMNVALGGLALGVGGFLHEAGILGVYLDAGVPLLN